MTWLQILLVSFVVTLLLMPPLIRFLRRKSFGITVRAEVVEHLHKMGTPKAGGLVFLLVPTVACLLFGPSQEVWALLLLLVCSGAIGFADDFISYRLSLIHISEPTRLGMISYAVFCLKKKKKTQ